MSNAEQIANVVPQVPATRRGVLGFLRLRSGAAEARTVLISRRVAAIDAARGAAMVFMFLSHFAEIYFPRSGITGLLPGVYRVSMLASPLFMIISGMMLGYIYGRARADFSQVRTAYIRRGLYLLTIVHVAILLAHIPMAGSFLDALQWGFITDTIGICMILGVLIVDRVDMRMRVWMGGTLYLASTAATILWQPGSLPILVIKDMFVGEAYGKGAFAEFFAIVPWFSLYLAASGLGEKMSRAVTAEEQESFVRRLTKIGLISVSLAIALLFAGRYVASNVGGTVADVLRYLCSPSSKRPPLIDYFLTYGGLGLLVLATLLTWGRAGKVKWVIRSMGVFGRTPIIMFILQYYLYYVGLRALNLPYSSLWPLLFLGTAGVMFGVAWVWDYYRLNRLLKIPRLSAGVG
jgi:uncharacterized membrane protein